MLKNKFISFFWVFTCINLNFVYPNPTGFNLKSGDAQITFQDDRSFVIQSNQNSVINWDNFSIGLNEHVKFQQMNEKNYVLNQVTGSDVSALHGTLTSNGAVYLINPNGILIGPNAYIETVGFVASTLDLLDEDLSKGVFSFKGISENDVINQGKIHCPAGDIFLIGKTIENNGTLSASQGRVGLLSGNDIIICPDKAPKVQIHTIEQIDDEMLEENPYALAICHDGNAEGKKIYLSAEKGLCEVSGELIATGETGGEIQIEGDCIHLIDDAMINVSGKNGGGNVFVGGGYRGQNPLIRHAKQVWVGEDTQVKADALINGNGGKVVFWSDQATFHYGEISVQGGKLSGDGGLAEVSGPLLEYHGMTYGTALNGKAGTLLLDPVDINIGGAATTGSWSACGPPITYAPITATATNQILNTDLQTQLGSCSVTIDTTGYGGSGPNNGSITVASALTWATANTLTLEANSYILVSNTIQNTSASTGFTAINLISNGNSSGANPGVYVNAAITTDGGDVIIDGTSEAANTSSHGVRLNATITTGAGHISITGDVPQPPGTSGAAYHGIYVSTTSNPCVSNSGDITLIGTTQGTASDCNGINAYAGGALSWTVGTSGTFSIGTLANPCQGGRSTHCHGVNFQPTTFTTNGPVVMYGTGGRGLVGLGGYGVIIGGSVTTNNNSLTVVGTTTDNCTAYSPVYFISGTTNSGNGNISITGNIGNENRDYGIYFNGGRIASTDGDIELIVTCGTATVYDIQGIHIGTTDCVSSTTGNITFTSDLTSVTTANGYAVYFFQACDLGTTGTVTFSGCNGAAGTNGHGVYINNTVQTSGDVVFTDCSGGTVGAGSGSGIYVASSFSAVGNITATTDIVGNGASSNGFYTNSNFASTGGSISINARAYGTTGDCEGIFLASGTMSTLGNNSITLTGRGGPSSGFADGISIYGGYISTNAGNITLTGIGDGSNISYGVYLATINGIVSNSGDITISGSTLSSSAFSHGFGGTSWNTGTTGKVTFSNCTGGSGSSCHGVRIANTFSTNGPVNFSDCIGGTGSGGSGINSAASFSAGGAITATSIETNGTGADAFFSNNDFTTSSGNISITATANGTSGACHGISLEGGGLSTTGGGSISLNGSGGDSATASHGINIVGGKVSGATGGGSISLVGTAVGATGSYSLYMTTIDGVQTSDPGEVVIGGAL